MADVYTALAGRLGYAHSPRLRAILELLMTPEQAAIAAEMPSALEALAQKHGKPVEYIRETVDTLFRKGLVVPRDFKQVESARFVQRVTQLHDGTLSPLRLDPHRHGKLFRLWQDFCDNEFDRDNAAKWAALQGPPIFRVVPAYRAILDSPELLPCEDVREIARACSLAAVVSCTCRKRHEAVGKKCSRSYDGLCLQFERGAEYAIARGSGTRLSLRETLDLLDECEEDGLVHQWINNDSLTYHLMCNCCDDCCLLISTLNRFHVPPARLYAKSRYEARIGARECTDCGLCIDRCPFGAISRSQDGAAESRPVVNPEKCMGCGACVVSCSSRAMKFDLVRPREHIPKAVPR